jgi:large subunit ribosomal protein L25
VPAVVYGRKVAPKSLWFKAIDFSRLLKKSGESTMIELNIDDKDKKNVIIYEIQKDPVTGNYIHADFFQVRMDEEIEKDIELVYIGEAPAVKELGGVLVKSLNELPIKCLPADLPSEIKVDISSLKTFEDHICIKDLNISPKIKIDIDLETVVTLVSPPRSDEELKGLSEEVDADVTKVEGVVKESDTPAEGAEGKEAEKKEEKIKE